MSLKRRRATNAYAHKSGYRRGADWQGHIAEPEGSNPALFRQALQIFCAYPAQEISYTKLLSQMQDRGNTGLVRRASICKVGCCMHSKSIRADKAGAQFPCQDAGSLPGAYRMAKGECGTAQHGRGGGRVVAVAGAGVLLVRSNDEVGFVY